MDVANMYFSCEVVRYAAKTLRPLWAELLEPANAAAKCDILENFSSVLTFSIQRKRCAFYKSTCGFEVRAIECPGNFSEPLSKQSVTTEKRTGAQKTGPLDVGWYLPTCCTCPKMVHLYLFCLLSTAKLSCSARWKAHIACLRRNGHRPQLALGRPFARGASPDRVRTD
jgi:hypothetical protein